MDFNIDYAHGWHLPEYWRGVTTRWMQREAHLVIHAPREGLVEFSFRAVTDQLGEFILKIRQGELALVDQKLTQPMHEVRSYASVIQGSNYLTLTIEGNISSPFARGISPDTRELSIAVQGLKGRLLA